MEFLNGAKDLARNPLGIIALFISLIYGFATLLLSSAANNLTVAERWPIIIFIVLFPIFVLVTFYKLVTNHHGKLYAPKDFNDDKSFLRTLSAEEQDEKLENEVKESLGSSKSDEENNRNQFTTSTSVLKDAIGKQKEKYQEYYQKRKEEIQHIETEVITQISTDLKVDVQRNIGIGGTDAKFDAFLNMQNDKATFLEVKTTSVPTSTEMLNQLLYYAVIADNYFNSKFKLIIAVVYDFEENKLESMKQRWREKVNKCPADVELRFIHKDTVKNGQVAKEFK